MDSMEKWNYSESVSHTEFKNSLSNAWTLALSSISFRSVSCLPWDRMWSPWGVSLCMSGCGEKTCVTWLYCSGFQQVVKGKGSFRPWVLEPDRFWLWNYRPGVCPEPSLMSQQLERAHGWLRASLRDGSVTHQCLEVSVAMHEVCHNSSPV